MDFSSIYARLFARKETGKSILTSLFPLLILAVLAWSSGLSSAPHAVLGNSTLEKGPEPWLSVQSERHIGERHIREDTFPEKAKFVAGMDYRLLLQRTYREAMTTEFVRDRWIYDWQGDFPVGRAGQDACRLVTARNGEVITFYPLWIKKKPYES